MIDARVVASIAPLFAALKLRDWRPVRRGRLAGFADISMPRIGLRVDAVPVFIGEAGPVAALPAHPLIVNGRHARDATGKLGYETTLAWSSRAHATAFSNAVIAAILKHAPEAFDRSAEPATPRRSHREAPNAQPSLDLGMAP
jgi:hypothetical protein